MPNPALMTWGKIRTPLAFFIKLSAPGISLIKPLQSDLYTHIYLLGGCRKGHAGGTQQNQQNQKPLSECRNYCSSSL